MPRENLKKVPAGEFKTHCLALLDRVARTGERIVVTKRGRPVACVGPAPVPKGRSLRGSVRYHGDILAPIDVKWNALL